MFQSALLSIEHRHHALAEPHHPALADPRREQIVDKKPF
jgi:hypothetical protein